MEEVVDRSSLWEGYEIYSNEQIKSIIRNNINQMCNNWISIGFALKQARDKEFYKEDGYSSIQDYAFDEFGIKKQRASKLIKIIETLSVNGNSPVLEDRWKEFSIAKLEEIIYLEEEERDSVQLTMTKVQIRDIGKKSDDEVSPAKLEPEEPLPLSPVGKTSLTEQDTIDFTRGVDSLAKEYEAKGSCPQGIGGCMRNGEEGEAGKKICLKCWKEWLSREKLLVEAKARKEQELQEIQEEKQLDIPNPYEVEPVKTVAITEEGFLLGWYRQIYDDEKELVLAHKSEELRQSMIKQHGKRYEGGNSSMPAGGLFSCYPDKIVFKQYGNYNQQLQLKWGSVVSKLIKLIDEGRIQLINPENQIPVNNTPEIIENQPEAMSDMDEEVTCDNCGDLNNWRPDIGVVKPVDSTVEQEPEIVEADVIQTETDPEKYSIADIQAEIREHTNNLDVLRKENTIAPIRYKSKMRLDAASALLDKLKEPSEDVEPGNDDIEQHNDELMVKKMVRHATEWFDKEDYGSADFYLFQARKELAEHYDYEKVFYSDYYNDNRHPQQPLPVLKNNDQRKDFIDNYTSWPVWIDLPHTGEKYYRYDLSGKVAIVVKVSRKHAWKTYKETKDYEYGAEQYYLVGIKSEWSQKGAKFVEDDSRTFYECNSNKSALVEYLKEFQKGVK